MLRLGELIELKTHRLREQRLLADSAHDLLTKHVYLIMH
jgi:hypothetical protein